jgi:hypothetical protein
LCDKCKKQSEEYKAKIELLKIELAKKPIQALTLAEKQLLYRKVKDAKGEIIWVKI